MDKPLRTTGGLRIFVCSLSLPLVAFFATAGYMSLPPNTRGIDVAAGAELFSIHCASCHFVSPGRPAHLGPNLHDIGRSAASRKPECSATEYILESILDPEAFVAPSGRPGMPTDVAAELAPDAIRNLVGFLASQGEFPDYDEIMQLEIPDRRGAKPPRRMIRLQEMQLAESVLREKGACLNCHPHDSRPEGRSVAPGLFGVGLKDPQVIHQALTDPHREIHPAYRTHHILMADGRIVTGQLVSRSDERLVLRVRDQRNQIVLRQIPIGEIETDDGVLQIHESKTSLMPDGFGESLSREEIDAVIKLIRQLN